MLTIIFLSFLMGLNREASPCYSVLLVIFKKQRASATTQSNARPVFISCMHRLLLAFLTAVLATAATTNPSTEAATMTMPVRGDDEIPAPPSGLVHHAADALECVGACHYKARTELQEQTPDAICRSFKDYCESPEMRFFCEQHGVNGASFVWNANLKLSRQGKGRRSSSCSSSSTNSSSKPLSPQKKRRFHLPHFPHFSSQSPLFAQFWKAYSEHPSLNLCLGFHGTADANVNTILKCGLDPQYRRTQAFGKGEYFSKEPGLSATYRKDGSRCLMVFLLLMPPDHEKRFSQKDRDIIVIPEACHQLPVGVLRFETLDNARIQHSQKMRLVERGLKQTALQCEWDLTEATLIQTTLSKLLVPLKQQQQQQQRLEEASSALKQATRYHDLSDAAKREIGGMIRRCLPDNDDAARTLFPSVYAPSSSSSAASTTQQAKKAPPLSLTALEENVRQAWKAFWVMKMDPYRNVVTAEATSSLLTTVVADATVVATPSSTSCQVASQKLPQKQHTSLPEKAVGPGSIVVLDQ